MREEGEEELPKLGASERNETRGRKEEEVYFDTDGEGDGLRGAPGSEGTNPAKEEARARSASASDVMML